MSRQEPLKWERGLRLPEGPKRKAPINYKNHHESQEEHTKKVAKNPDPTRKEFFVPAVPPKTNAWGTHQPKKAAPSLASTMLAQAQEADTTAKGSSSSLSKTAPAVSHPPAPNSKTSVKSPWKTLPPVVSTPSLKSSTFPQHSSTGGTASGATPITTKPNSSPTASVPNAWGVSSAPVTILTKETVETKKKAKRGKPKLKNLQLGDLVPKNHIMKKASEDFPTLSSSAESPRPVKRKAPKPTAPPKPTQSVKAKPKMTKLTPAIQDRKVDDDEAFSLLRQFTATTSTSGRQRIKPRKKKFTSLKKKVLEERLRRWKELHPDPESKDMATTIQLLQYLDADTTEALEDDDEYQEIVQNLRDLAEQCGVVKRVFVPRTGGPVFCEFTDPTVAQSALNVWNGLVLGGQALECKLLPPVDTSSMEDNDWNEWCLNRLDLEKKDPTIIMLENALTEDDLEDEDCLEESLADIRNLVALHGTVLEVSVASGTTVKVSYEVTNKSPTETLKALSQLVLGGQALTAKASEMESNATVEKLRLTVFLDNVLTDDDLEDEDALLESIEDLRELANAHGKLESIRQEGDSDSKKVCLEYTNELDATKAYKAFHGMVIGGVSVIASRPEEYIALSGDKEKEESNCDINDESTNRVNDGAEDEPKVMYSGDKIISERFAECKRVPKIVNQAATRHYAKPSANPEVKPLLQEMLTELMRLQKRAVEENNTKAKRRLVMGLREVARGIRSHKVKMVIMATNLDEYGVIDEKLQEIIDLASTEQVPIFYELTKRAMGKAIGKTIKVAVIGVQSAEGTHQQFKKLSNIARKS